MVATNNKSKRRRVATALAATSSSADQSVNNTSTPNHNNAGNDRQRSFFTSILLFFHSAMGNDALDDMTMFEIIYRHPLVRVATFIMVPYLIYVGNLYLQLQHPEYITKFTGGLIQPRPAVHGTNIPRQVLIVTTTPGKSGQSSSGTVEMAMELRKQLSLEIGHGYSDAAWRFTRDGTISWFHGIRFLSQPEDTHGKIESVMKICNSGIASHTDMGFHPSAFGPPNSKCSYLVKWDECWKRECYLTLLKEWGCGISDTCEVKFASTILQVRNPMLMLEGLVKEYCIGGVVDGVISNSFLVYASAIFPRHDFHADSCIEATGTFLVMYLEAMLEAMHNGEIDAYYQIEQSSVCDVAKLAGLLSANTTVYGPNHIRISRLCDEVNFNSPAQQIVAMKSNKIDDKTATLEWEDLRGGMHGSKRNEGDGELGSRLKNVFTAFEYNLTALYGRDGGDDFHSEL